MKKDILQGSLLSRPVSKEGARLKYERYKTEDRAEQEVKFESLAETRIKKAMADGMFDNLPGKGRPIDFNKHPSLPEHLRTGYQMLKNSGYFPEEVRLKKQMAVIKTRIQRGKKKTVLYETQNDVRGQWLDFRFDIRFAQDETGQIHTWLNGKSVIHYQGRTAYQGGGYFPPHFFRFKTGLYRDHMPGNMTIYLDEYRKKEVQEITPE